MPKSTPIKTNFNGGEFSPLFLGRTDIEKYPTGCSILQGFYPTEQGPIVRRGGTAYTNEVFVSSNRCWLKEFIFNVNQSYTLEFGNQYIRFYTNRGLVLEAATTISAATQANPAAITDTAHGYTTGQQIYIAGVVGMTQLNGKMYLINVVDVNHYTLTDTDGNAIDSTGFSTYTSGGTASRVYTITTPYAVVDLTDTLGNLKLKFLQLNNVLYMYHTAYQTQKLLRNGNTNWSVVPVSFTNGPFQVTNNVQTTTVYGAWFSATVAGTASNGGLIRVQLSSTAGLVTGNQIRLSQITGTTEANGRWTVTVIDSTHVDLQNSAFANAWVSGGVAIGEVGTSVTLNASAAVWQATDVGELFYIGVYAFNVLPQWSPGITVASGATYRAGNNTYIALNAGTSGTVTPIHTSGSQADGNPGITWLYTDSGFGVVQITAYSSATQVTATIVTILPTGVIGSTKATYLWAHSLFSTTQGWPELGVLFRDRQTLFKGIQMASSVTSDYENFAPKIGGVQTPDSGIVITLPTANPTRWAADIGDLIVGTAGEEIVVNEISASSAFAPTNVRAHVQSRYGSRNVVAQIFGYGILFVSRSGQKVRDYKYTFQIYGYDGVSCNIYADHIAKGSDGLQGIIQVAEQQEPYSILWAVTTDGKLIGFTYNREEDIKGWHNHPIGGNGFVESVCCQPAPDGTRDDVWIIVRRTINGVTRRYVEYIAPEFLGRDATIANAFYVDAGLTYTGAATTTITGFYHLKNTLCDVLANGGVHPPITIDNNGTATLQYPATVASIGLSCPARIRTVRMEGGSQLGTSQGKIKRITSLVMRLFKTLGGWYGSDEATDGNGNYIHMDEIQYRQADGLMDTPPPMLSGDTDRLQWPSGDDTTDGYIEILFNTPTPATVVALMADEQTNEN